MAEPTEPGPSLKIRSTRLSRGMSLRQLAAKAGVSAGLISQVERGMTEPSLGTMRKIAKVLQVPLFSLFDQEVHDLEVVRHDERIEVKSDQDGIRYSRLSSSSGVMDMLEGELSPHSRSSPEPRAHSAHECVVVVSGHVSVTIDSAQYDLGPGDSCYFDSRQPHMYRNERDEPAKYIVSVAPPSY